VAAEGSNVASTAIGLDIGTSSVRAAQVTAHKGSPRLDALGQVALPEGAVRDGEVVDSAAVTAAIAELWKYSELSGKRVTLGVASSRVIVRQVDLPWLPADELKASLAYSVHDLLPVPLDSVYLDFCPLEEVVIEDARMVRGLLVAAPRELVLANLRAVQDAGLKPVAVDLAPFAVLRTVGSGVAVADDDFGDDDTGVEALVEVGAGVTTVIVHEHGVPRFVRLLPMGGQNITDAVAERLGVDQAQAEVIKQELSRGAYPAELFGGSYPTTDVATVERAIETSLASFLTEVRGSLDFYASSPSALPLERVVLTGGGARLRGLADRLRGVVSAPVAVGAPFSSVQVGDTGLSADQLDFLGPLSAVPLGLALGALA
jgi:type IV pilus assembly protein PilM